MHQLKTRVFQRWQKKSGITDAALLVALAEMQAGLIDADLGGGVVKKRVALAGRGKSGGARTLLATNKASRWVFVYGFEKNQRANITPSELETIQIVAGGLLALNDQEIEAAVGDGALLEIKA
jgi:hypothetical protein